jgi:hypothetical protein
LQCGRERERGRILHKVKRNREERKGKQDEKGEKKKTIRLLLRLSPDGNVTGVELVVERVDGAVQRPVLVADVGRADEGALLLLVLETTVLASVGHVLNVDVLLRVRATVERLEGGVNRSEGVVEVL